MTAPEFRLVAAQTMDALTFAAFFILVPVSQFSERNPIIAGVYALGGFAAVGLLKVGIALAAVHRAPHSRHPRLIVVLMSAAAASGIVGAGFNIASLMLAKGWA